jgi:hypothetical protein
MADETLQAFQLGASLFDRAQTQKRMMEQFQQQTAESLLQRQGLELQNKIRESELAGVIGERQAQVDEFNTFSNLSKQVGDYLDNPESTAKFPVVPAFKSKTYRIEADKMLNNLEKYSARAKLLKATSRAEAQADAIAASTLNKAIELGAIKRDANGKLDVDVPLLNQRAEEQRKANIAKTTAQTTSILTNLDLSRDKLKALIANNASDAEIAKAKLEVQKSFNEARIQLDREELDVKKLSGEEQRKLNREKFDLTKGVQLKKLELQELDLGQRVKRTDAYVQNLLKPVSEKDIKLNVFDDSLVRKTASFVANQQSAADAIEKTMEILDDPTVDESVKIRTAQLLAKDLNDPKGRDAVGNQEADRILGELDIISFSRAWDKGNISDFLGRDLSGFREKLGITKSGLDSKISKSIDRVNSIYKKYEGGATGTSQAPSMGVTVTGGKPQPSPSTNAPVITPTTNAPAMSQTNAPAMSGTNTLSEVSFKSIAEALSKGKKPGDSVIINGVPGKLK